LTSILNAVARSVKIASSDNPPDRAPISPARPSIVFAEALKLTTDNWKSTTDLQNEKATRHRVAFSQGRVVPTEVKNRQNFLAKSYESKKGSVKKFLGNKYVCFQLLTKKVNSVVKCLILR